MNHHLREIADCLDEALRLQSRVMDLTEQVYEALAEMMVHGRPAPCWRQRGAALLVLARSCLQLFREVLRKRSPSGA